MITSVRVVEDGKEVMLAHRAYDVLEGSPHSHRNALIRLRKVQECLNELQKDIYYLIEQNEIHLAHDIFSGNDWMKPK